jgi:hypothetical protein
MSKKLIIASVSVAFALVGCAQQKDDPANVPLMGNWNSKIELESVTVDGTSYTDSIPKEFTDALGAKVTYTEMGCAEPRVNTAEELNEKLPPHLARMCKLKPTKTQTGNVSFESECDQSKLPEGVIDVKFTGEPEVRADFIGLNFRVQVTAKEPDGSISNLDFVQSRTSWRTGECKG